MNSVWRIVDNCEDPVNDVVYTNKGNAVGAVNRLSQKKIAGGPFKAQEGVIEWISDFPKECRDS